MSSADLVHLKGFGSSLCCSMKARMSASSWRVEVHTPRCSCLRVSSANQRPLDDLGHLVVRQGPRPSRPRFIRQSVDALFQEAAAPLADRVLVHAEFGRHRLVRQTVCAAQDHAAAIGHRASERRQT